MATAPAPPPVSAAVRLPVPPSGGVVATPPGATDVPATAVVELVPATQLENETPPPSALSEEEKLKNLQKEIQLLTSENHLLGDYLLRLAAARGSALSDISEENTESDDEEAFEYASRSSIAQSFYGRGGSILEGAASRRGSSAGFPGLRPQSSLKTEPLPDSNLLAASQQLNPEEKNDIATRQCASIREEINSCVEENERMLDELRAACEESVLRIGEVRRDSSDFYRDVLAERKLKGNRGWNAGKILKFLESKLSKKASKAAKVRERNQALNLQIAKMEQLLASKKELSDLLHAVDFEQLQIHKQQNQQRLRERLHELNRLKASNTKAAEALDTHSWQLSSHIRRRSYILEQLIDREPQLAHVRKDIAKVTKKKDRLEELFHIFIQERDAQLGEAQPNVLEYMELKERVYNLHMEHHTWSQKVEIAELCSQQPSAHQSERDMFSVNEMVAGHEEVPTSDTY